MEDFYRKTQDKITDFSITSAVSGFLYSVASSIEGVYQELEDVKREAFIATSTGKNVDMHIEGTYGLARSGDTRASGYVVLYANAPIQDSSTTKIWCAKYDPVTDTFQGLDKALRCVTSGSDDVAGKVFVIVAPNNEAYYKYDANENGYYIEFSGKSPQFIILPVVSNLKGSNMNVPEGSVNILSDNVSGINGVINTYSPILTFFSSYGSLDRLENITPVLKLEGRTLNVVNSSKFPNVGLLQIENTAGRVLNGVFVSPDGVRITAPIKIPYSEAYSRYFTIPQLENPLTITRYESDNSTKQFSLTKIVNNGVEVAVTDINAYLQSILGQADKAGEYNVRQVLAEVDKRAILDPDNVMSDDGTILESAHVGGGTDSDTDSAYKYKLRKYLSSLGKSTPSALEAGALTVKGVTYAKCLPKYLSPRGSSTLLVSSSEGSLTISQMKEVKSVLEENWKSAGEGLIIKAPEKIELSILVKVGIQAGYSKELVNSQIKNKVRLYVESKLPGDLISNNDLISDLRSVEGVSAVYGVYIGKKLTPDTYTYVTRYLETSISNVNTRDGNEPLVGYGHGLLAKVFNSGVIPNNAGVDYSMLYVDREQNNLTSTGRYKITGKARNVSLGTNVYGTVNVPQFASFMNEIHSLYKTTNDSMSVLTFEEYESLFQSSALNANKVSSKVKSALNSYGGYQLELVKFMTEPLRMTSNVSVLPISFPHLRASDLEPVRLDMTQIPVVGQFRDGLYSTELIGVEFV